MGKHVLFEVSRSRARIHDSTTIEKWSRAWHTTEEPVSLVMTLIVLLKYVFPSVVVSVCPPPPPPPHTHAHYAHWLLVFSHPVTDCDLHPPYLVVHCIVLQGFALSWVYEGTHTPLYNVPISQRRFQSHGDSLMCCSWWIVVLWLDGFANKASPNMSANQTKCWSVVIR